MPYVTYPNLGDIYKPDNLSLLPTMIGFQREEEAQKNNLLNQLAAEQEYAQNQQMNPLRVQNEQELLKQRQLSNDFEEKKKPLLLQELGNKANSLKQDQLTQLGGMMYQVGKAVEASGGKVPLEMEAHLPKEIVNLLSQPDGYKQAIAFGEQILKGSPKSFAAAEKAAYDKDRDELKARLRKYEVDERNKTALEVARIRGAVQSRIAAGKSTPEDKRTLQQQLTMWQTKAGNATSQEERDFALGQFNATLEIMTQFENIKAGAKEAGKIDSGSVGGLPTKSKPTTPTVPLPSKIDQQRPDPLGIR